MIPTENLAMHEAYIHRCMELAAQAVEAGNDPFGSVITRDGEVIAESNNQIATALDVTAHGEVAVIRLAAHTLGTSDLSGASIYTNCEPCYMCSYAIRASRLSKVIIGARAPIGGGVSSIYPILLVEQVIPWAPVPVVVRDVLREECEAQLRELGFVEL